MLSRCITLPKSLLDTLKFSKLKSFLNKKGNHRTKALVKTIDNNADAAKRKEEEANASKDAPIAKTDVKPDETGTRNGETGSTMGPIAGAKRPRAHNDSDGQRPTKKIAPRNDAVATAAPSNTSKPVAASERRGAPTVPKTKAATAATAPANAVKPKEKHVTAKPSSFFEGLTAASKAKPASTGTKVGILKPTPQQR